MGSETNPRSPLSSAAISPLHLAADSTSDIATSQPAKNDDKLLGQTHSKPTSQQQKIQSPANNRVPAVVAATVVSGASNTQVAKSHKIEGKNKKSLHHKQQTTLNQQQQQQQTHQHHQQQQQAQQQQQTSSTNQSSNGRRNHQKNPNGSGKPSNSGTSRTSENSICCSTLDEFSKRAQEIKAEINSALEKQASYQIVDQPIEVIKLKQDILKLSGLEASGDSKELTVGQPSGVSSHELAKPDEPSVIAESAIEPVVTEPYQNETTSPAESQALKVGGVPAGDSQPIADTKSSQDKSHNVGSSSNQVEFGEKATKQEDKSKTTPKMESCRSDSMLTQALEKLTVDVPIASHQNGSSPKATTNLSPRKRNQQPQANENHQTKSLAQDSKSNLEVTIDGFEPLNAKLDTDSKYVALVSSLQKHFSGGSSHLLEPVCRKLVNMSEQNDQLALDCEKFQSENRKLSLVKQKLENLCRELQKSNNAIRIESLDLIKVEQGKAKEQTTKIQSTLSGVIKLFDENQQRNMTLRQENHELQTKLKSLLDHCDNWEKSVEAALRQRDIENRLLKTELAKANLLKNEEKEKLLGEKQELLQLLSMMQEQQHRIEGQEAKLRSDLSSYASKYDECQAVISKGMNRFQAESKRMLKQIEKSKQDYKVLLLKYESSNKKMAHLLEEKQHWDRAMNLANKKIETLERLCRALRERKSDGSSKSTDSSAQKLHTTDLCNQVSKDEGGRGDSNNESETKSCSIVVEQEEQEEADGHDDDKDSTADNGQTLLEEEAEVVSRKVDQAEADKAEVNEVLDVLEGITTILCGGRESVT